ncbi:MAG: FMN-binding protein [Treponema sp.]|nr:FMN-binding protein [Treponema sp.]
MTRKLSYLAVVILTLGLLFAACPIQFDPYDVIDDIGGSTPIVVPPATNGWLSAEAMGHYNNVIVGFYFTNGVLMEVHAEHHDSPDWADMPVGAWLGYVRGNHRIPPILPLYTHGIDAFSGATGTVNGLTTAARNALGMGL